MYCIHICWKIHKILRHRWLASLRKCKTSCRWGLNWPSVGLNVVHIWPSYAVMQQNVNTHRYRTLRSLQLQDPVHMTHSPFSDNLDLSFSIRPTGAMATMSLQLLASDVVADNCPYLPAVPASLPSAGPGHPHPTSKGRQSKGGGCRWCRPSWNNGWSEVPNIQSLVVEQ